MSRDNDSTPGRGETWYGGRTIDTNNLDGVWLEGQEKVFEDIVWSGTSGVKSDRGIAAGRSVRCRLVRNNTGITLLPKKLVQLEAANPGRVSGYVVNTGQKGYPVDEFLPSTGVPNGDLFWIVVQGPATVLSAYTGAQFGGGDVAAGVILTSVTTTAGSTQTGTTSENGRAAIYTTVAATTAGQWTLVQNVLTNFHGRALSARTTAETNSDLLIDVLYQA
jgi:hypothetical protein